MRKNSADGRIDGSDLEELFVKQVSPIPAEMARDVYVHVAQTTADGETPVQHLADLVDLFHVQYDDQNDPLPATDWPVVRDLVDQYAGDLDMELVQYVMERVVGHKAI